MNEAERILEAIEHGDAKAADELLPLVYDDLRKLAAHKLANEAAGHTLQPTALVHEAWLRLTGNKEQKWDSRGHFFAAAAEAMRRILIDNARRKRALRHGGSHKRVDFHDFDFASAPEEDQVVAVNEALEKFGAQDKKKAELVKLRYFAGLTIEQAASVMGVSEPTAKRQWAFARAWLYRELREGAARDQPRAKNRPSGDCKIG